jgi:hypothetical protein
MAVTAAASPPPDHPASSPAITHSCREANQLDMLDRWPKHLTAASFIAHHFGHEASAAPLGHSMCGRPYYDEV